MQTFNQLFFKKKQIFSYFFKEISEYIINLTAKKLYFAKFVSITGLIVGFTTHNQ